MMSFEQMDKMARAAERRSRREGILPVVVNKEDLEADVTLRRRLRSIPFIGDRVPRGWKRLNACYLLGENASFPRLPLVPIWHDSKERFHFMQVDTSGFGAPDEPALTQSQFMDAVRKIGPGKAYALIEVGQFQGVVAIYEKRS